MGREAGVCPQGGAAARAAPPPMQWAFAAAATSRKVCSWAFGHWRVASRRIVVLVGRRAGGRGRLPAVGGEGCPLN